MRKLIWVGVFSCLATFALADEPPVTEWLPAVVKIASPDANRPAKSAKPSDQPNTSFGSGVILDTKGAILTNAHVVKDMSTVRVTFNDGHTADATKIFRDADTDLALIRLEEKDAVDLQAASFAAADATVGQPVVVIGSPYNMVNSVTFGHVSALHRRLDEIKDTVRYQDFLQTDAAINPGNSGGPLFNYQGEIIGIVTATLSKNGAFSGVGFAIPASLAKLISTSLLQDGRMKRGFLGARTVSLRPAEKAQYRVNYGVKVVEMPEGDSPARRGGLRVGDVVLKVAGTPVLDPRDFVFKTALRGPNRPVALYVLRDGQPSSLSAELTELTDKSWPQAARTRIAALGAWGEPMSTSAGNRFGFDPAKAPTRGFLITDIEKNSLAENAELEIGSVILQVERNFVSTAAEVQAELTDTRLTSTKGVLLVLASYKGQISYAVIRK